MTDLLSHPLIVKYFGCHHIYCEGHANAPTLCMAHSVLQAMQEPIKMGVRYLELSQYIEPVEKQSTGMIYGDFHPMYLTLPPAHQKREKCCCMCHSKIDRADGFPHPECDKLSPEKPDLSEAIRLERELHNEMRRLAQDPVEAKIDELVEVFGAKGARNANEAIRNVFRELVALCKREFEKESR